MLTRAITGFFFLLILLGAIIYSERVVFILFLLITILASYEFYKLRKIKYPEINFLSIILPTTLIYATFAQVFLHYKIDLLILISLFCPACLIIADLFHSKNSSFSNTSNGLFSAFYIGLPFSFILAFITYNDPNTTYNFWPILVFFIILWTNDTFAYLSGKLIGKNKLWERISPNKTWEGFFGGFIFSIIAGILLFYFTKNFENITGAILFSASISIFGTLGDLSESLLKRQAGVKDSGNIMPGHGGLLDRFDGVLLAAPTTFLIMEIYKLINS